MRASLRILVVFIASIGLLRCARDQDIEEVVAAHPELIMKIIREHPQEFADALRPAMNSLQAHRGDREHQPTASLATDLLSPHKVTVESDRPLRGSPTAKIQLVVYSDFMCPYCRTGAAAVAKWREQFGDNVAIAYKHLPLPMHRLAMPAALRFEALAKQSSAMAWAYHDQVFAQQDKIRSEGEAFLDELARGTGADMQKLQADLGDKALRTRIEQDAAEAKSLGITGTPGYLLNGIVVRGANPTPSFATILATRPINE